MFHYGEKPINNIKKDFININLFEKTITNYPEPITDLPVKIDTFVYQDDFEICLLRFNHIIFGNNNKINLDKLKNLIGDSYLTNDLYLFFNKNNNIKHYISIRERQEWCKLLNNITYFNYRYDNKYKLSPVIYNIFIFYQTYFPSLLESPILLNRQMTTKDKITKLFKFLDTNNIFTFKYFITGHLTDDKIYEENLIKIFINDNNIYDWELYQYYENLNNSKGKLITGYSELKYSYYLNKFSK